MGYTAEKGLEVLNVFEKFLSVKETVKEIKSITTQDEVRDLANQILEEL